MSFNFVHGQENIILSKIISYGSKVLNSVTVEEKKTAKCLNDFS